MISHAHTCIIWVLLILYCSSPAGHARRVPLREELTVMSFNIRYGTAADGENHWMLRRGLLMEVIERNAPEILCLQEALAFQIDAIRERIPGYGVVGVGRDDGLVRGEHCAILFDNARFIVSESGTFWFSDTPLVPGSTGWGNTVTRICTWARFVDTRTDRAFYIYNIHLDHESQQSRERSVRLLARRIEEKTFRDPLVVAGDFNAGVTNPALRPLLNEMDGSMDTIRGIRPAGKMRNAVLHQTNGGGETGTYHGFTGTAAEEMIDQILVSEEWEILDAKIDRTSRGGRFPSDHFPVIANVRLITE